MRIASAALAACLTMLPAGLPAAAPTNTHSPETTPNHAGAADSARLAEARWIRDPRFEGQPVLGVFEAQRSKAKATELKNLHTYFRKEFALDDRAVEAQLCFSADDYAKIYVNGRLAAQGPEPAYPFAQPYYRIDVSELLAKGPNCLAVHAYYHGLACRAFNSADNRSGLIARLEVTFADGSRSN